ncbi:MAG: DUF6297 family protein [Aeromicrobium sp.]
MTVAADASARSLRRQMRSWRRERADTTLYEQVSDAYVWIFSIVVIGAMAISALIQTRVSIATSCTAATCEDARTSLVWASVAGVLAVALASAQAVGPVMVTPATGAWLLTTPIDRGPLLRSRLYLACITSAVVSGAIVALTTLLAGFDAISIVILSLAAAAAGAGAAAAAAAWQPGGGRTTRWASFALGALTAAWMLLIALDRAPSTTQDWTSGTTGWIVLGAAAVAATGLIVVAARRLTTLLRAQLVPGGSLVASLSGALAGLDFTLAYDVLVARRWLTAATVRPVRGGPGGMWALVWRDVVRLRRSPGAVAALVASLLIPYVVVQLGLDDVILLASAFAAFVTGIWLCSALRTTARNPGLIRCFPMSLAEVRAATLVVPAAALVVWSLAAAPAIGHVVDHALPTETVLVALATGMAALGAIARWLLAPPPNYSQPLISSPAGGIPTGLVGSTLRGFDVLLLLTVPLLVAPDATGALISLALNAAVLGFLVNRR